MNIVVITEGRGEKYVYKIWIPYLNPSLTFVDTVRLITTNNFSVQLGGGSNYFDVIDGVIEEVNDHGNIDRLVLTVDSEEMSLQDKYDEIHRHTSNKVCSATILIVVQHRCLETWALGNRVICSANPTNHDLILFKQYYDVRTSDPELLPPYAPRGKNRAQFAALYLRAMLKDRHPHHSYTKGRPKALRNRSYFDQVQLRRNSH